MFVLYDPLLSIPFVSCAHDRNYRKFYNHFKITGETVVSTNVSTAEEAVLLQLNFSTPVYNGI